MYGILGVGEVVLKATTVQSFGLSDILGLNTITGLLFTISGTQKPWLKSHIKIVPFLGCSCIDIQFVAPMIN
jgi:hypothetical protein